MKYISTNDALIKLNMYGLTEHEVIQEFNGRVKANSEAGNIGDIVLNWKNEDIIILPIGKKTALLFVYGQEIKGSYEDLPQVIYKNDKWCLKET